MTQPPQSSEPATASASDQRPAASRIWVQGSLITILSACLLVALVAGVRLAMGKWTGAGSLAEIEQLAARRDWTQAERRVLSYLVEHPDEPAALELYARTLAAREAYADCARVLEQVPDGAAERGPLLLRAGQAWQAAMNRRGAERAWTACLQITSDDLEWPAQQQQARRQLCDLFALERRRHELWNMTAEMLKLAPPRQRHEPLEMRTRYRLEMVEPALAIALLAKTIETDPDDLLTRRAIGLYELEAGNAERARDQLHRCVSRDPQNLLMHEAWLDCLTKMGAEAFELELALRALPSGFEQSPSYWNAKALLAEKQQDQAAAIEAAGQAARLDGSDSARHYRLAQLLARAGRTAESQEVTIRAQELQDARDALSRAFVDVRKDYGRLAAKSRGDLAYRFGQTYEKLGIEGEAAAWYRVALAEDPAHSLSVAALERLGDPSL